MHEEALLRDLRRALDEVARSQGARRLSGVVLWVGALSHVTEASLRSRWPETVRGSAAEGAALAVVVSDDPFDARADRVVLREVRVAEAPREGREAIRPRGADALGA